MLAMYTFDSPDMLYDFHDSNAVLLLAILIAIVKSTPGRLVDLADVVILLRLMWLIVICGFSGAHVVDEFQLARRTKKLTTLITAPSAILFRGIVVGSVATYNVWFWFRGVEFFNYGQQCATWTFFFTRLSADGRLQSFYQFTSVVLMLFPPSWLLAYFSILLASLAFSLGLMAIVLAIAIVLDAAIISVCMAVFVASGMISLIRVVRRSDSEVAFSDVEIPASDYVATWKTRFGANLLFQQVQVEFLTPFFHLWKRTRDAGHGNRDLTSRRTETIGPAKISEWSVKACCIIVLAH